MIFKIAMFYKKNSYNFTSQFMYFTFSFHNCKILFKHDVENKNKKLLPFAKTVITFLTRRL